MLRLFFLKTCLSSFFVTVRESGIPLINVFFIELILINLGIVTKCRMRYYYLYYDGNRWNIMVSLL
jgi:hypothetical protein